MKTRTSRSRLRFIGILPRDETEEEQQKWKERRIVYYISGVLPGEYVVESACLSNPADEIFVSTERQTIMVEP